MTLMLQPKQKNLLSSAQLNFQDLIMTLTSETLYGLIISLKLLCTNNILNYSLHENIFVNLTGIL